MACKHLNILLFSTIFQSALSVVLGQGRRSRLAALHCVDGVNEEDFLEICITDKMHVIAKCVMIEF